MVNLQPAYAVNGEKDDIEGSATTSKVERVRDPGKDEIEIFTEEAPSDEPAPTMKDSLVLLIKEQDVAATKLEEPVNWTEAKHEESTAKLDHNIVIQLPT